MSVENLKARKITVHISDSIGSNLDHIFAVVNKWPYNGATNLSKHTYAAHSYVCVFYIAFLLWDYYAPLKHATHYLIIEKWGYTEINNFIIRKQSGTRLKEYNTSGNKEEHFPNELYISLMY